MKNTRSNRLVKLTETLDKETGELVLEKTEYTYETKTPKFIIVLDQEFDVLLKKLTHTELKVFLVLATATNYNKNTVNLTSNLRYQLSTKSNTGYGTFSNALSSLSKKGFIKNYKGDYYLNHKYVWRGETKVLKEYEPNTIELED